MRELDRGSVVEVAGRLAEAMGVASRASFVACDVTGLANLDGPFDIAFLGWVLPFLDPIEIDSTLRQVHRLLAMSGRIVIREVCRHRPRSTTRTQDRGRDRHGPHDRVEGSIGPHSAR